MTAMHSRKRSDCGLDGESCASLAALVRDLLAAYMHSRFVLACVMLIDALVESQKACRRATLRVSDTCSLFR